MLYIHTGVSYINIIEEAFYLLGEESRSRLLEFRGRSYVGEGKALGQCDLGYGNLRVQYELLADVLRAAVVVKVEGRRGVRVDSLVVHLRKVSVYFFLIIIRDY